MGAEPTITAGRTVISMRPLKIAKVCRLHLAVLYMEMGRRLGLDIEGVGLPGHFVVRVNSTDEKGQLIDVFEGGKNAER